MPVSVYCGHSAALRRLGTRDRTKLTTGLAIGLLAFMALLAWGAARQESATFDEIAYIGAGLSYVQKLDMRLYEEHPPLIKVLAAIPLSVAGVRADYSGPVWTHSSSFFSGYAGEWIFGGEVLLRWNDPRRTLSIARVPMLLLTLTLGWCVFLFARRLGGDWAGLLCLTVYVSSPLFLGVGPLVITDVALALFALLTVWTFASLWQNPNRRNVLYFGLALAAAILSKLPSGVLFIAIGAFVVISLWRPMLTHPLPASEYRTWRNERLRATLKGILLAALAVYLCYFILSWNQPMDIPGMTGNWASRLLGRMLMPPWLFGRSLVLFVVTAGRNGYLLGHYYWHGVWFYFPVLLALKSAPGFIGLLMLLLAVCLLPPALTRNREAAPQEDAQQFPDHWRMVWVTCAAFSVVCILSHYNGAFRYFSFPVTLLIMLLAAFPRRLALIGPTWVRRGLAVATVILAIGSLATALQAYPYYIPYVSAFGLGRPAWMLVNGGNLDWNQGLYEAEAFARARGIEELPIHPLVAADVRAWAPHGIQWDCETAGPSDAGRWVVVSATTLVPEQPCAWLWQYPHRTLAGGSLFAVRLPAVVPALGRSGRPIDPSRPLRRFGIDADVQSTYLGLLDHPDRFPGLMNLFEPAVREEARRKTERVIEMLRHP